MSIRKWRYNKEKEVKLVRDLEMSKNRNQKVLITDEANIVYEDR